MRTMSGQQRARASSEAVGTDWGGRTMPRPDVTLQRGCWGFGGEQRQIANCVRARLSFNATGSLPNLCCIIK